ncbi:MAG: hypothetical protein LAO55_16135 [Acidobacteriia bacterium]|nr:hypothetical protein [Terriglobia bacterium]
MAAKLDVVAPAPTVTSAGTVALGLLLDSATASPPLGAALLRVTVQAEDPGAFTVVGEHESALSAAVDWMTVMTPPVPEAGIAFPKASDATIPLNAIGRLVLVLAGDIVMVAVATAPFPIAVVFTPKTTQVVEPPAAEQERLFPAAIAAELAVTLIFVTSAG